MKDCLQAFSFLLKMIFFCIFVMWDLDMIVWSKFSINENCQFDERTILWGHCSILSDDGLNEFN